jgi:hypothetical protein
MMTATAIGGVTKVNAVIFTLPDLPPSINTIYAPKTSIYTATPRFEIKAVWKQWSGKMQRYIKPLYIAPMSLVRCDLWIFHSWFYKNGNLRRQDVHNMVKYAIDVIAKAQDWDDEVVKFGSWGSTNSTANKVVVRLTEVRHGSDDTNGD